eukprot:286676-Pyramimonas_sp.AAC.1
MARRWRSSTTHGSASCSTRASTGFARSRSPIGLWTARGPPSGACAYWIESARARSSTSTSSCPSTGFLEMISVSRFMSRSCGRWTTSWRGASFDLPNVAGVEGMRRQA